MLLLSILGSFKMKTERKDSTTLSFCFMKNILQRLCAFAFKLTFRSGIYWIVTVKKVTPSFNSI